MLANGYLSTFERWPNMQNSQVYFGTWYKYKWTTPSSDFYSLYTLAMSMSHQCLGIILYGPLQQTSSGIWSYLLQPIINRPAQIITALKAKPTSWEALNLKEFTNPSNWRAIVAGKTLPGTQSKVGFCLVLRSQTLYLPLRWEKVR